MYFNDTSVFIPLTQGKVAMVDFADADLGNFKWSYSHHRYAVRIKDTRNSRSGLLRMHRLILERMIGRSLLPTELPDHINGDTLDNRRSNLRIASATENARNAVKSKANKSGYKGVHFSKSMKRWCVQITVNRKCLTVGFFDTPEAAALAYNEAAVKYHGEYAKLNQVQV